MGGSDRSSGGDDWGDAWSGPGQAWSDNSDFGPSRSGGRVGPSAQDTGEQPQVGGDMWDQEYGASGYGALVGGPNYPGQQGYPQPGQTGRAPFPGTAPRQGVPGGYGQQPPMPPQMQPQYQQPQKPGGNGTKIALIVVLALILVPVIGVLGFMLATTEDDGQTQAQNLTEVPAAPTDTDNDGDDAGGRADGFEPPASWTQCGGSGDLGQLNYAYSATTVTSCEFSVAVRDAVAEHFHDTDGETNSVLNVRSPVTGDEYTMTCNDDGTVITCEGGNNAVVKVV